MGKSRWIRGFALCAGAMALAVALFFVLRDDVGTTTPSHPQGAEEAPSSEGRSSAIAEVETDIAEREPSETEDSEEPMTAEERAEAEAEKLVDAFDAVTDTWQEPAAKGVTMEDVNAFVRQFDQVPKDRKEECLQRALNLIPDENVMLLVGVLMDTTQDKELIELVFNDILNRDDDVKMPILRQILKDKDHPCRSDAAWILDVTL